MSAARHKERKGAIMKHQKIAGIFADASAFDGQKIRVCGWVRTVRDLKNFGFIELNDGSCFKSLQVVFERGSLNNYDEIAKQNVGAALIVDGTLVLTPKAKQPFELKADAITVEGASTPDYPLQKKRHSVEFLRTIQHLRPRTNLFSATFRVRSVAAQAVHEFFQSRGFVYVNTPIITGSDCEGAGEMFRVTTLDLNNLPLREDGKVDDSKDFFGKVTSLTVSGQLNAENFAMAFGDVYTFGPTFRAENSNTKTHAAEFWMIEPEICFCDLNCLMDIEEDFLKSVVQEVLDKAMPELEFLQGYAKSNLIEKLQTLTQSHVARVTHAEAIDILQHATHPFEHPAVQGEDLFKEHEKYLTEEHFKSPVFVYDWPKEIKAFYMYQNDDGKTVRGVDLLVPGSGELMGGSERETRLDLLTGRMDELHISKEQMDWYVNLRRFGGCTHSGFGMGFERLIMYLTDIENIRDVIPYPRTPGNCEF